MQPLFIDKDVNVHVGDEAAELLKQNNDSIYFTKDEGIVKIPKKRWFDAQEYEKNTWMKKGFKTHDDRNFFHKKCFDNYDAIKNMHFNNALEIGCGPFTNLRIIGNICKIEKCDLIDPLINDYFSHPFNTYNKEKLFLQSILGKKFSRIIPPFLFKNYLKLFSKSIKINNVFNTPFEEFNTTGKYDLIVFINVIEHCFDINLFFENVLKLMLPKAIIIFQYKLYNHLEIANEVSIEYDAGHPLRVDKNIIEKFINGNFKTLYKRIQPYKIVLNNVLYKSDDLYFIGEKL
jgi:SAM-dependent methyltransferase